jgi:hypothetical protein
MYGGWYIIVRFQSVTPSVVASQSYVFELFSTLNANMLQIYSILKMLQLSTTFWEFISLDIILDIGIGLFVLCVEFLINNNLEHGVSS